jgi:hypothetical protein
LAQPQVLKISGVVAQRYLIERCAIQVVKDHPRQPTLGDLSHVGHIDNTLSHHFSPLHKGLDLMF